jgi:hypothetical protein
MCSITEPRRATVSCKHLFSSSTTHDRSNPTSSSRRHGNTTTNPTNVKRNNTNNTLPRSSVHSTKQQQQRLNDVTNETSNVIHIPFCIEQINDNEKKHLSNNNKSLRISLNPLSPVFYSTRHTSLLSVQKQDLISR